MTTLVSSSFAQNSVDDRKHGRHAIYTEALSSNVTILKRSSRVGPNRWCLGSLSSISCVTFFRSYIEASR